MRGASRSPRNEDREMETERSFDLVSEDYQAAAIVRIRLDFFPSNRVNRRLDGVGRIAGIERESRDSDDEVTSK